MGEVKKSKMAARPEEIAMEPRQVVRGAATKIQHMMNKISSPDVDAGGAIDFLMSQHRDVEALFNELETAGDRAVTKKDKLAERIVEALTAHTKIEETIFYPAVKSIAPDLILESFEEHAAIKGVIRRFGGADVGDESFDAKAKVLKELVQHHVKEEEDDLFPQVKSALSREELADLGRKMQVKMAAIERQGEPQSKRSPSNAAVKH